MWAALIREIEAAQPIPAELHGLLETLVRETGETAVLAAASGSHALFLDAVESPHAIRYTAQPGKLVPLHVTATGRALLSQMTPEDRAAILRKAEFKRYTDTTLMTAAVVEDEVQQSRKLGWFEGRGEYTTDLGGREIAAIDIIGLKLVVTLATSRQRSHARARGHRNARREPQHRYDQSSSQKGVHRTAPESAGGRAGTRCQPPGHCWT